MAERAADAGGEQSGHHERYQGDGRNAAYQHRHQLAPGSLSVLLALVQQLAFDAKRFGEQALDFGGLRGDRAQSGILVGARPPAAPARLDAWLSHLALPIAGLLADLLPALD